MKKLLFATCLLLSFFHAKGQYLDNGGFEDEVLIQGDTFPAYWSLDAYGRSYTHDAHTGSRAISVWNWYYYGRGWAVYGDAMSAYMGGGRPVATNPATLTGWYKYVYGLNGGTQDSAVCEILLFSHAQGTRDTISNTRYLLGPSAQYTFFEIPIQYSMPQFAADTIVVKFISSVSGFCDTSSTGECLYLTVDDVFITPAVGVPEIIDFEPSVELSPSPSQNGFRIMSDDNTISNGELILYDFFGRRVFSRHIYLPMAEWINPQLPQGNYLWELNSTYGQRFAGKWQVH